VAAELILVLRLARLRSLRDQIDWIGVQRSGKSFECAFTIDMLDGNARAVLIDPAFAGSVNPVPEREGKASGKALVFGATEIERDPR
jgi:hypothetical protein